jgi:ribosomal protein S27AE
MEYLDRTLPQRRACRECGGAGWVPVYDSAVLASGTEVLELVGRASCPRCGGTGEVEE